MVVSTPTNQYVSPVLEYKINCLSNCIVNIIGTCQLQCTITLNSQGFTIGLVNLNLQQEYPQKKNRILPSKV